MAERSAEGGRKIRIAINGFGRIGRTLARLLPYHPNVQLVAINDPAEKDILLHLLKYDSVHGQFQGDIRGGEVSTIYGSEVQFFHKKRPGDVPWGELRVDVVLESSGMFKTVDDLEPHLQAGAGKVILSSASADSRIRMVVLGVNDQLLERADRIVSNASCTANCAAPMIAMLDELCHIQSCYITTVHSYTGDQRLQDAPHVDLRRARGAAQSIVPTTTGAAKALTVIFPHLREVIGGCGIRVPVPNGSLTDLTCHVSHPLSSEGLNEAFRGAANTRWKGILECEEAPVVSRDIIGNTHSCVIDSRLTSVIGNMVKVVGWYDNETGYSKRLLELVERVG